MKSGAGKSSCVNHSSPVALLLVDVINDFAFPQGRTLLKRALPMAKAVARLKAKAKAEGIPCLYVNDNFGQWRSNFSLLLAHCLDAGARGCEIVSMLEPEKDDYVVLKPVHSGFAGTPLALLLEFLGANTLILGGLMTDSCVAFTANDAYLRNFRIFVPSDCSASLTQRRHGNALAQMRNTLKADTRPAARLDLKRIAKA